MKKISLFIRTLAVPLMMIFALTACDDDDAVTVGTVDFNNYIESVDKTVAEPGDVITITGRNLDAVYKIMLNNENVPVVYTATFNKLEITVPSNAPLGDVITINLFFSGKGVAQRAIKIQSPPVIMAFTPSAALPGTQIRLMGREMHLATQVYLGEQQVSFTIVDDRMLTFNMPVGSTGGEIKIISATGGESFGPTELVLGQEIMIQNFDGIENYYSGRSNNGNIDVPVTVAGDFIRGNFLRLPIIDKSTSWGGNFDIYMSTLPALNYENVSFAIDIRSSKNMNISLMVQNQVNVYGKTVAVTGDWQTIVIPVKEMLEGYGNNGPGFSHAFNSITTIKIQPPAGASAGNFGESVSIDNVKFIVTQ